MACTLRSLVLAAVGAAFGPAGVASADTLVVLNKAQANASLLDPATGKVRATVPTGIGPHEVVIGPDGRTAVVANYGEEQPGSTLTVFDVESASVVRTIDLGPLRRPHGLAWLPQSRVVVVTVEDNKGIVCVDVDTGKVHALLPTDQHVSHMVALTPDGRRAFVANIVSGSVTAFELPGGKKLTTIPTGAGAEGIAVTPDGAEVWITNREADTVTVLDAAKLEIVASLPAKSFPIRVAITPDGKHALVSNAKSATVEVFDAKRHVHVRTLRFDKLPVEGRNKFFGDQFGDSAVPIGILVDPRGAKAYVALAHADLVAVVDLRKWKVVKTMKAGVAPDGLAYTTIDAKPAAKAR
jgi:YVTN family beta-propeller protein